MGAIRGRLFKGTFAVVSGCLIIVTSFEKSHPAHLPVYFENTTAISRLLGNTDGLSCGRATVSLMLFSPGGGRFLVGISGVHVPSPHGRLLGGDLEDMKPARHTVQQTFRGDGHLVLSSQSMVFLTCFGGEGKQSSRKWRCLFPSSEHDQLTPAV